MVEPLRHGCAITKKVAIGISSYRWCELKIRGEPVPDPIKVLAVVDTGASFSFCDPSVISALGMESLGIFKHWSIGGCTESEFFRCAIYLGEWSVGALSVASEPLRDEHNGIDLYLGRDVLQYCMFMFDPKNGVFSLLAPNPS